MTHILLILKKGQLLSSCPFFISTNLLKHGIMNINYTVGEVELSYKPKFKSLYQVTCSKDAYKYLLPTHKEGTICY